MLHGSKKCWEYENFFYCAELLHTSKLFLQSNSKTSIYEKGQKSKTKGNTL